MPARVFKIGMIAVGVFLIGAQFVPLDRENPPVEENVKAPVAVRDILERACYDCHSNLTRWPWYSRVAPLSWLIAKDVREGRRKLNFSMWSRLSAENQGKMIGEIWEEVSEGGMPPRVYRLGHPEGRLTESERSVVRRWAEESGREGHEHGEDHD